MRISRDRTRISFGKLSNPGVLQRTPLSQAAPGLQHFKTENFQYIVDHIVDIFGLDHGCVHVDVESQDYQAGWVDYNHNNRVDDGELVMQFTMNACIYPYTRESVYGKNFMYQAAREYGSPVIFGIAAHEIGHLINLYTLCPMESRILRGQAVLVQTARLTPQWDELCADYLAGIVLAKSMPRLSQEPLKAFLRYTEADSDHPDGFWRTFAVEMGYQWGCNNSPMLTDRILTDTTALRQLLESFFKAYWNNIYSAVPAYSRNQYSSIPQSFLESTALVLGSM